MSAGAYSGLRVVVYGLGAMGCLSTRLLVDKGAQIVGAIARSPAKCGRALGDVAGLDQKLGVLVEDDADAVLARGADIAVVCVSSYLDTMRPHFETCLRHGVNVVTIEEETVFPWTTAPDHAKALDTLAKTHGVTLAASGAQDVFWLNLVSTLLGASHHVDRVTGHCRWNVDDYGPEVAGHLLVGQSGEAFDTHVATHGWPEFVARQTLEALTAKLGLHVAEITSDVTPLIAEEARYSRALGREILPGEVLGTVDRTHVETREGPGLVFAMEGRVFVDGETDTNHWEVVGEPALSLHCDNANYRFTTCSTLINRLPDVIAAPPGLCSLDQLPPARFQPHGMKSKA